MAQLHHVAWVSVCALLGANLGCSDSGGSDSSSGGSASGGKGGAASGGSSAAGGSGTGGSATGGSGTGGSGTGGSATGGSGTGGSGTGGSGGTSGSGGTGGSGGDGGDGGTGQLPRDPCIEDDSCPTGTWINVTPDDLVMPEFGAGPIVKDPDTASDLYMGGGGDGLWKSTDYGWNWTKINAGLGYVPMGYIMSVFPGNPVRIVVAGYNVIHVSTDGGTTFSDAPFEGFPAELYSMEIDPYDSTHVISGIHEANGILESSDSGQTWTTVGTTGFPSGGKSWYPFFIDTGDGGTTATTWIAIAQDGGSVTRTTNGGDNWSTPTGVSGLQHVHGNSQVFQSGNDLYVPGSGGPGGGLYKSTDLGLTFSKIQDGDLSVAWGTDSNVYAMYAWACGGCDIDAKFTIADLPGGTNITTPAVPDGMKMGANHVAVTNDGTHNIFVGMMWQAGPWLYVEE